MKKIKLFTENDIITNFSKTYSVWKDEGDKNIYCSCNFPFGVVKWTFINPKDNITPDFLYEFYSVTLESKSMNLNKFRALCRLVKKKEKELLK